MRKPKDPRHSKTLKTVGSTIFYGCARLQTVNFEGTLDEWTATDYLINSYDFFTINCSDGYVYNGEIIRY